MYKLIIFLFCAKWLHNKNITYYLIFSLDFMVPFFTKLFGVKK